MSWIRCLLMMVFATLMFSGCAAKQAYKRGMAWETQGEMYQAGQQYIVSLDKKSNPEVLAALKRVAEPGYEEGLALASTAQNNADFPKALTYYKNLKNYTRGLTRHNALTFEIIDIDAYINDMRIAAARERYAKGKKAMSNGDFNAAISHFKAALDFKKGFSDAAQMIAECHYLWAEALLAEFKYRPAAKQFVNAQGSLKAGYKDSLQRGAGIYYTIGKWYVDGGYCQKGWVDLKEAKKLIDSPKVKTANAKAEDCAIRDIGIVVFSDSKKNNTAGVHVETIMAEHLVSRGGDFAADEPYATVQQVTLRLRDFLRGSNPFRTAGLDRMDRLVTAKLESVEINRGEWSKNNRSAQAMMWDRCPEGAPGLCERSVTLYYSEYSRNVTMDMKGFIDMVKAPSGGKDWSYNFRTSVNEQVVYADGFIESGIAVNVGSNKALGVVVPDKKLRSLANAPRKALLGAMSEKLIKQVVEDSAKDMVSNAAAEPEAPALPQLVMESVN